MQTNSLRIAFNAFLTSLFFILTFPSLFSQYQNNGFLIDDGLEHTIPSNDPATYEDLKIPANTSYNFIRLSVKGADGGRKNPPSAGDKHTKGGGEGAMVKGTFVIGNSTGEIPPGSTLRFIVGHHGGNTSSHGFSGGGGGGGTGVILIPVGEENDSDNWVVLAVGGGGAGAGADCCYNGYKGDAGKGKDSPGNGSAGASQQIYSGGGGGAFSDAAYDQGGEAGFPEGGNGGDAHADGGWGFGGGGAGVTGSVTATGHSGSGGGYSGGSVTSNSKGKGGTSFLNTSEMTVFDIEEETGGSDKSPDDGVASYALYNAISIDQVSFTLPGESQQHLSMNVTVNSDVNAIGLLSRFFGSQLIPAGPFAVGQPVPLQPGFYNLTLTNEAAPFLDQAEATLAVETPNDAIAILPELESDWDGNYGDVSLTSFRTGDNWKFELFRKYQSNSYSLYQTGTGGNFYALPSGKYKVTIRHKTQNKKIPKEWTFEFNN